jgi:hypothetical protein
LPLEAILPRAPCISLSMVIVALTCPGFAEPAVRESTQDAMTLGESATRRAEERVQQERSRIMASNYVHWFGSLALGRGLRFNNPYRLERVLGDDAESMSLSALYADVAAGLAQGDPSGLQHGLGVHLSAALTGIRQEVLTPSYRLLFRPQSRWSWTGRFGLPLVLEPDVTAGFEVGVGAVCRFLAGLGIYAELIGSIFYGAATLDHDRTTIPMLSSQIGIWIDYEVIE